ncbi:hypothetical protein G7058_00130 [Jeotgalibaca porci]|uniref:Uncharacterized protein n=1 Tax=Jeotgalibaca porci TaxID=1868793 RepID=A0A6G7WEF3_9LACT|nr:hypothetical protein [Jeotgalibaca porci]QIK50606.1 hypothetical protein G7058_00130 [Jeotgalibaca porci]
MKKEKVIKELEELYRQYIKKARSLEDPYERDWVYGKVDGITEAIDIVQLIDEQEVTE